MLKKQYKIFLAVFFLVVAVGAALSSLYSYTYAGRSVGEHTLAFAQEETSPADGAGFWFTFEKGCATLHYTGELSDSSKKVWFRYPYGEADTADLEGFSYNDAQNGTLLVQTETADGGQLFTAKSQTLNTQGYDSFAWDVHTFGDASIPLEICYGGSSTRGADISVLVYGEPYTGSALLQKADGTETEITVTEGYYSGLKIADLRQGVAVTVTEEDSGRQLTGSYIVEDYPFLTSEYLPTLFNFLMLPVFIAGGVVLVCGCRGIGRRLKRRPVSE